VSSSKLRGVLDERTSDQRRRRRSERRFEIIRSFGDFSRSGSARLSFCSTREQQQQQSKKKREIFERKARGFKRDQSHLQISFAASFCVFLAGGSSVEEVFFAQNLRKRRSKKRSKKEQRKKEKKKYHRLREERQHRDNRTATKVAAFVSRIIFVSRIRRL
jgi:hypothetical protein